MEHLCPSKMWCTNHIGIRWTQVLFLCSKGPMATFASSKKAYLESFQLWPWPLIDWSTLMIKNIMQQLSCFSFLFVASTSTFVIFCYFYLFCERPIGIEPLWDRKLTILSPLPVRKWRKDVGSEIRRKKMKVMLWFVFAFFSFSDLPSVRSINFF